MNMRLLALLLALQCGTWHCVRCLRLQEHPYSAGSHQVPGRQVLEAGLPPRNGPPNGQYEVVLDTQGLLDLLRLRRDSTALIRMRAGFSLRPCTSLSFSRNSQFQVDCQGATLDFRCGTSALVVSDTAEVHFYSCHFLWKPDSSYFNSVAESNAFHIGFSASLQLHDGSSSLWCSALSELPSAGQHGSYAVGAVNFVDEWAIDMKTTDGMVSLQQHMLYCMPRSQVPDMSDQEFQAAIDDTVTEGLPNQRISITGVLRLNSGRQWNGYNAPLPGPTFIAGISTRSMIDLQRNADIFSLSTVTLDGRAYSRRLHINSLTLYNLPRHSGNAVLGTVTSLLWFANEEEEPGRFTEQLFVLNQVTAVVECGEVDFWTQYVPQVQQLYAEIADGRHQRLTADVADRSIVLHGHALLGIMANNYTVSCESHPQVELIEFDSPGRYSLDDALPLAEAEAQFWITAAQKENETSFIGSWSQARLTWVVATTVGGSALVLSLLMWAVWRAGFCGSKSRMFAEYTFASKPLHRRSRMHGSSFMPHASSMLSPMKVHEAPQHYMQSNPACNAYCTHSSMSDYRTFWFRSPTRSVNSVHVEASGGDSSMGSPTCPVSSRPTSAIDSSVEVHGDSKELPHHWEPSGPLENSGALSHSAALSMSDSGMHGRAPRRLSMTNSTWRRQSMRQAFESVLETDIEDEHLEIDGVIGGTGYGAVYGGTWRGLQVAIKMVVFEVLNAEAPGTHHGILEEAEIAYNLSHTNVVTTLSHGLRHMETTSENGADLARFRLCMIQEYCAGGSLANLIRLRKLTHPITGGLHMKRVLAILKDVASGMAYVHSKNIAHGHLTPYSILFQVPTSARGEQECNGIEESAMLAADALDIRQCTAKVADFGLSVQFRPAVVRSSNIQDGRQFYTAPELRKNRRLQCSSDTYSFGVIMWQLFIGRPPHVAHDPTRLDPDFPKLPNYCPFNYAVLALACMSKSADDRPVFSHMRKVLGALERELATGKYRDATGNERAVAELIALTGGRPAPRVDAAAMAVMQVQKTVQELAPSTPPQEAEIGPPVLESHRRPPEHVTSAADAAAASPELQYPVSSPN